MGAWGTGYFDNDDAGELVDRVREHGWADVEDALRLILNPGQDYLEAPSHGEAIDAAAIVATKNSGLKVSDFPDDVELFTKLESPPPELIPLALRALALIKVRSELADLWIESGRGAEWTATIDALQDAFRQ